MRRERSLLLAIGALIMLSCLLVGGFLPWLFLACYLLRILLLKERRMLLMTLSLLLLFSLRGFIEARQQSRLTGEEKQVMIHVWPGDIQVSGDQLSFIGRIPLEGYEEKVQVFYYLKDEAEKIQWTQQKTALTLKAKVALSQANGPSHRSGFNYQAYLKRQHIYWLCELEAYQLLPQKITGLGVKFSSWRRHLQLSLQKVTNHRIRAYLKAILFNDKSQLDPDAMQAFKQIGLIHLFSLSGFHVTYLCNLLKKIGYRLGLLIEHVKLLTGIILVFYTILLAWPYGMLRAVISWFIQNYWPSDSRTISSITSTSLAMLLILIIQPLAIFSLGFQLSFALSYTVLITAPIITRSRMGLVGQELRRSFLCTLVTIPFLLYWQFEFPWLGIFVNYFYSLFFTIILMPGLLILLMLNFAHLLEFFAWVFNPFAGVLLVFERVSQYLASLSFFTLRTGVLPWWTFMIISIVLLTFIDAWVKQVKLRRHSIVLILALICLYLAPYLDPYGHFVMISMGQGDCLYIELPHQRGAYLVDVGGQVQFPKEKWQEKRQHSTAQRRIIPALKAEGVRGLDGVFITHSDYDHYGSLEEVAAVFPIKALYLTVGVQEDKEFLTEMAKIFKGRATKLQWLKADDRVKFKHEFEMVVLHPRKSGNGKNETSLVLYGKIGPKTFLLTGDIEGEGEQQMMTYFKEHSWPVDILKVAHHGSNKSTSQEVLDILQPKEAWISVGKNTYGHPSPELLKRLNDHHAIIYRADMDGSVYYHYRKNRAWVETTHEMTK